MSFQSSVSGVSMNSLFSIVRTLFPD